MEMPKVGIEPTLPKEHEFESCASASSATSASAIYFDVTASIKQGLFSVKDGRGSAH
jgi:hypothetical protein